MTVEANDLARTVLATRPIVPAKDFMTSKQFYSDLGFQSKMLTDDLAEMSLGACSFVLQNYYVRDWADNFVIHLYVSDLRPWWDRIVAAGLARRYGVKTGAPHRADWGATVAQMIDPAGVLWWLHEVQTALPAG
ncbi:MAG: glyoxalase [Alphaproteobacteria bacterium]|nr:glyoxalase [Alphaproteobacteria bacterium]